MNGRVIVFDIYGFVYNKESSQDPSVNNKFIDSLSKFINKDDVIFIATDLKGFPNEIVESLKNGITELIGAINDVILLLKSRICVKDVLFDFALGKDRKPNCVLLKDFSTQFEIPKSKFVMICSSNDEVSCAKSFGCDFIMLDKFLNNNYEKVLV